MSLTQEQISLYREEQSLNLSSMNLELIKYFCGISLSFLFVIEMFFADVPVLLAALNTSLKT